MKPKPLKLWNGRAHGQWMRGGHFFVCAHSKAEACRLLAVGTNLPESHASRFRSEINDYYSEGLWGDDMECVTPEVGLWVIPKHGEKPIKLA